MLKTSAREMLTAEEKPPNAWAASDSCVRRLSRDFFQQLLVNVEVSVHVLHVVMLFERLHQANHGRGLLSFELDEGIRNHAHARRSRLDTRPLQGFDHAFI